MGNQVCRYTMLTRPPEPMCSPVWAQVELRKCLFTRQPTIRAIAARPYTSPRELMDRVRRCTGEMFQPTRLKGRAFNTLVPSRHYTRALCPRCCCCHRRRRGRHRRPFILSRIQPCATRRATFLRAPLRPRPRRRRRSPRPLRRLVHFSFYLIFFCIRCIPYTHVLEQRSKRRSRLLRYARKAGHLSRARAPQLDRCACTDGNARFVWK